MKHESNSHLPKTFIGLSPYIKENSLYIAGWVDRKSDPELGKLIDYFGKDRLIQLFGETAIHMATSSIERLLKERENGQAKGQSEQN